mmetsp:Transcript_7552/g.21134  ORF Transcript_7552/g.21134 Transcript_7552/m.21134 type:complete len:307 (-) Transcript_7552:316-1236(-)
MAASSAFVASPASLMVAVFFAFSAVRISKASFPELSMSESSSERVAMSCVSIVMEALPPSISAVRLSIVSESFVRVSLLSPISLSQKPSWSASPLDSSKRRVIMSSISFFTFANGSDASFCANKFKDLLCNLEPSSSRNWRTFTRMPLSSVAPRKLCTKDRAEEAWAKLRCLAPAPCTSSPDRILMAWSRAWISSSRSCCFSLKDSCFSRHSILASDNVFSSSTFTVAVEESCFLSEAIFCSFSFFLRVLVEMSSLAVSAEPSKSCASMSEACLEFISSFSKAVRSSMNLSRSFSNISMTPWDWNS